MRRASSALITAAVICCGVTASSASSAASGVDVGNAAFAFSRTFGDNMVLALSRTNTVVVWGTGEAGSQVKTTATGAVPPTFQTTVGHDGIWRQEITGLREGFTPTTIVSAVAGGAEIALKDVLIGKVILCSGQVCCVCVAFFCGRSIGSPFALATLDCDFFCGFRTTSISACLLACLPAVL